MKKIIAILLCLVLVVCTFAGCASKEPQDLVGDPQGTFDSEYLEALEKQMSSASIKYDISQTDKNTLLFDATRNVSLADYNSVNHEYDDVACKAMVSAILNDAEGLDSLTGTFVLKNYSGEKLTEKSYTVKRYDSDNINTLEDLDDAGIFAVFTVGGQKNMSGVLSLLGDAMTIIVKCVDENSMMMELQIDGVSGEYLTDEQIESLRNTLGSYLEQYREQIKKTFLNPLKSVDNIDVSICLVNSSKTVIASVQDIIKK